MLSTPPAFILSQDQTLMLKVLIQPEHLAFPNQKQVPTGILIQVLLFLRFALLKAVRSSFDDLNYYSRTKSFFVTRKKSLISSDKLCLSADLFALESFKVIHCSVINVLCFALLRQLDYFIKSLFVCQALFYFLNFVLSSLSCDSLFILSKCFSFVKNFFVLFCISVLRQKKAQGVGFEPTRPCGQTVFKTASL